MRMGLKSRRPQRIKRMSTSRVMMGARWRGNIRLKMRVLAGEVWFVYVVIILRMHGLGTLVLGKRGLISYTTTQYVSSPSPPRSINNTNTTKVPLRPPPHLPLPLGPPNHTAPQSHRHTNLPRIPNAQARRIARPTVVPAADRAPRAPEEAGRGRGV